MSCGQEGLNLSGIDLGISAFTETIAPAGIRPRARRRRRGQSFVETAADRGRAGSGNAIGKQPFIIANRRADALKHFDEILKASDGIMVARRSRSGIAGRRIAVIQKRLIFQASCVGKRITACRCSNR